MVRSSNLTKKILNKDEDISEDLNNNNLPNFIVNQHANDSEIIDIDNTEGKKKIQKLISLNLYYYILIFVFHY